MDKDYYFLVNNKYAIITDDPSIKSLKKWLISKNIKKIYSIDKITEKEYYYFFNKNFNKLNSVKLYYDYY